MSTAVLGVDNHNGWANFVTVEMRGGRPLIVDRLRAPLLAASDPLRTLWKAGLWIVARPTWTP